MLTFRYRVPWELVFNLPIRRMVSVLPQRRMNEAVSGAEASAIDIDIFSPPTPSDAIKEK